MRRPVVAAPSARSAYLPHLISQNETLSSPCVRNCCLDESDVCIGCGRTLEEIRSWGGAADREKLAILARAAERRDERERRYSKLD